MFNKFFKNTQSGFSLLELLVALAIFSVILLAVVSFFFSISLSSSKTRTDRDALENARRVLNEIAYEIKSAQSIYTPTTTASQLSLQTAKYLPPNENSTFIDFYLCGKAICFKKEFQDPVVMTSDIVEVTNLVFTQLQNGSSPSIRISLTASSVDLTTTASVRSY